MKKLILFTAVLSLLILCAAACGETDGYALEPNTEYKTDLYSYTVRTPSAVWYIARADIDLNGLDAMRDGLFSLLDDMEADFRDARDALHLTDVPQVIILTDLAGHAEISKTASAYYTPRSGFIKVFHNWDKVRASLMHEYVHYLTFACVQPVIRPGFWAEGVAEYVSRILCRDRMARSVDMALTEEEILFYRGKGLADPEDGHIDAKKMYYADAELCRAGYMTGEEYYAVCNKVIERTEKIQQSPKPDELTFWEAASMTAYLTETYGEDFIFAHWDSDPEKIGDLAGVSFPELYARWAEWNTARCLENGIVIE